MIEVIVGLMFSIPVGIIGILSMLSTWSMLWLNRLHRQCVTMSFIGLAAWVIWMGTVPIE